MKKCPYCAEEIQDDAIKCKHCKEFLTKKEQSPYGVCTDCNSPLNKGSDFCPACGVMQVHTQPKSSPRQTSDKKNKTVAALLALILGGLGIHRFYLQKGLSGLLYLIFCWTFIPAVIGFIEGIRLFVMSEQEFDRLYNR